jgi:Ca2+-binding RTX toxin-like protein
MPSNNENNAPSPGTENLRSATILTMWELSEVSYDAYTQQGNLYRVDAQGHVVNDSLTLAAQGWTQITAAPVTLVQIDTADHYQGVAFYKVINGITEVVIANRGSQPGGPSKLYDYTNSDGTLAANGVPKSDASALKYYNAVVAWLQTPASGITGSVNIIETGHSLGGQEADFVEATETTATTPPIYATQAVTFNAPGLSTLVVDPTKNYDALNISVQHDFVHTGGAALNAGYAGTSVTISGGTPLWPFNALDMIGLGVGGPVGAAAAGLGVGGFLYNGLYKNHVGAPIDAYFAEHPALGGVDLQTYSPTQVTQAAVIAMAKISPLQYANMTPAQRATFYATQLSAVVGGGGSANTGAETYTVTSTDSSVVLTGSLGDTLTLAAGSNTIQLTDSAGNSDLMTFSDDGTKLLSDSWARTDGVQGTDSYQGDGSSTGKTVYASGGYATYSDDGQGNVLTDYYSKNGTRFSWAWSHSDGTTDTGTSLTNGLTKIPDSPSAFDIPSVEFETFERPDGSYSTVAIDAQDQITNTTFDTSGTLVSTTTQQGAGRNFDTSQTTSTSSVDSAGNTETQVYDQQGHLISAEWNNLDGSTRKITYNASGAVQEKDVADDHSSDTYSRYGSEQTHDHFDTDGNLQSDEWQLTDGTIGTDNFQADGSGVGTVNHTDGTTSTVEVDPSLDVTIYNKDSNGRMISQDWWHADGTHGINVFHTDGSKDTYSYTLNGQVNEIDYSPNGSVARQSTVPAGMVLSPDGSQFGKITSPDGTYSIDYVDSNGNALIFKADAGGHLQGTDHVSASRTPIGDWAVQLPDGSLASSPYNDHAPVYTDSDGTQYVVYISGSGVKSGQDWKKTDGSHGTDVFNPDGSSSGSAYNADGTYYAYTNDGSGDVTTDYYDANATLVADAWTSADGSLGSDQYNADGSSSGKYASANGNYIAYADDGQGNYVASSYSAAGAVLASRWQKADGSYGNESFNSGSTDGVKYLADGSYATFSIDVAGDDLTKYYTASNALINEVQFLTNGAGNSVSFTIDPSGNVVEQTWTAADRATATDSLQSSGLQNNLVTTSANGDSAVAPAGGGILVAWGNQDTLTAGGAPALIYAGGTGDVVQGGSGDDTLVALGANTTLIGGGGNDRFEVNDVTDVVQEAAGGVGTIVSSVNFKLPGNVDSVTLIGSADLTATGNSDVTNIITGNSGNDNLIAGSGSDTLVSGSGVDTLIGGSGADSFVINNSADEIRLPNYNGYQDTIYSSVSYTLSAAVKTLTLTGSGDLTATDAYGYAAITGNGGSDTLIGGSGSDTLIAGTGIDTLVAGTGDNTLPASCMNGLSFHQTRMNSCFHGRGARAFGNGRHRCRMNARPMCCFVATMSLFKRTDPSPVSGDVQPAVFDQCWLRRDSANSASDAHPVVQIGKRLRHMQHYPAYGALDPDREFEQLLAQRAHLSTRELPDSGVQAQLLPQHIGGSGQQNAQLVGQKARAARTINLQSMVQFLQAILNLAASAVDLLVQVSWRAFQVGHDEALVVLRLSVFQTNHFGFDQNAPLATLPTFSGVPRLSKNVCGLASAFGEPACPSHHPLGAALQNLVFSHSDDVVDVRCRQEIQQHGSGKPSIQPHEDARPGKGHSQPLDHPIQNPNRSLLGRCVARAQHVAEQVLVRLPIECQKAGHRQITPGAVMAVEKRQLLSTMRWIVRRIQVDRHVFDLATAQTLPVPFDHALCQGFAHPIQVSPARRILKTRQCRLRGERCTIQRIPSDQQLLDRVLRQSRDVIAVGIPAGDPKQPLPHQIPDRVLNLAGLPAIDDALRQPCA